MSEYLSPWQLPAADLHWSEHDEPFSNAFGDIYFSRGDGLAETEYVFLEQNRLAERWRALDPQQNGVFVIGETGFGTGLNFLCAWRLWRKTAPRSWRLHYVSVEKFPLDKETLARALQQWQHIEMFAELGEILLDRYPPRIRDFHLRHLDETVTLQLLFGDAANQFNALHDSDAPELANAFHVDAWFLDGFAPAKNPEMWQSDLFEQIGRLSKPGTTFATFTVAGIVKRGLQDVGFAIEKFPGFGSKRQMLRGEFNTRTTTSIADRKKIPAIEYWAYSPAQTSTTPRVVIIGGGLAGATTAHALAKRHCEVILLERETSLATAASGNPQGVLYTKLSAQDGTLNRFALASYLFALDYYRPLITEKSDYGDFCGVLQLLDDTMGLEQLRAAFSEQNDWLKFVDAERASQLSNCNIAQAALWFSRAGWLSPKAICEYLTHHAAIDIRVDCAVSTLSRDNAKWRVSTTQGEIVADFVVIANAYSATLFEQTASLPLKAIRGQITELPRQYLREYPRCVICHDGYLTPSTSGLHIGATFDLHENDTANTALRAESHRFNLQTLHNALPELLNEMPDANNAATLNGRVGYRCTTSDYLPIVGAVADERTMRARYAILAKNAHARVDTAGAYIPGLYINVGHGSRGLTSTPLCAELLASLIVNEPRPLPRDLRQALSPARFMLRDLIRGR
ncbi:MAG: bifunctional tRNA (5-methylaminomethyl-2-thiouridine)(34)-methyltransferase MnmD/FAD-dependent 5-carboxymethylaminomethyl-2-thiouridine(34) oxidoreductase MnmC [Spongiibacteraceae bacterium]